MAEGTRRREEAGDCQVSWDCRVASRRSEDRAGAIAASGQESCPNPSNVRVLETQSPAKLVSSNQIKQELFALPGSYRLLENDACDPCFAS